MRNAVKAYIICTFFIYIFHYSLFISHLFLLSGSSPGAYDAHDGTLGLTDVVEQRTMGRTSELA